MKNIVFIANHNLTLFFEALEPLVSKKNVNVFWITASFREYRRLSRKYSFERVLCIDKSTNPNDSIDDYNLNEIVYADRVLKYNISEGLEYLKNIQKPIKEYLKNNNIQFVFGEKTWGYEEVIYRIINKSDDLNCKFLSPMTLRVPSDRFSYFEEPKMNIIHEVNVSNNELETNESEVIQQPFYLKQNDLLLKRKNSFIGVSYRFFKLVTFQNRDKNSPRRAALKYTLRDRLSELLSTSYYNNLRKTKLDKINSPFVFVALHMQPEATVDIMGRFYENQQVNIINLWRKLPEGWSLVVKEHSNAVGCRGRKFYRDILKLPNVILADEKESSLGYIKKSEVVVTVTGTVALEALLLNKISFVFGEPHFVGYGLCYRITLEDLVKFSSLKELIFVKKNTRQKSIDDLKAFTLSNSFVGVFSDPVSLPSCMEKNNLNAITGSILTVLNN